MMRVLIEALKSDHNQYISKKDKKKYIYIIDNEDRSP